MKLRGYVVLACFALSLGSVLVACGDDSSDGSSDSSGGGGKAPTGGDAAAGEAIAKSKSCGGCHGADLSGGPALGASNLTSDKDTGLGNWTDAQIATAIREGTDDEGEQLCATMLRFAALSDTDVGNLVAYLRSLPAVSNEVPETCQ